MPGVLETLLGLLGPSSAGPNTESYTTKLSPKEEAQFQQWKQQYAPRDSGVDYDLRGAFKEGLTPDPFTGHWSDKYKKPNHPTFSDQSIYAPFAPEKAGRWEGEKFIPPSPQQLNFLDHLLGLLGPKRAEARVILDPLANQLLGRSAEDAQKGEDVYSTVGNSSYQQMYERQFGDVPFPLGKKEFNAGPIIRWAINSPKDIHVTVEPEDKAVFGDTALGRIKNLMHGNKQITFSPFLSGMPVTERTWALAHELGHAYDDIEVPSRDRVKGAYTNPGPYPPDLGLFEWLLGGGPAVDAHYQKIKSYETQRDLLRELWAEHLGRGGILAEHGKRFKK